MASKPDFAAVASAALSMAHILLPEWIGGKRQGNEWLGESKANGGPGNSWCVNLTTGAWLHGAGDEKGGDLVSLYAARNHLKQGAAVKDVAQRVGLGAAERSPLVLEHARKPTERPAVPIPLGTIPPSPHSQYGEPVATYRYGDAFWVCRYDCGDGKKLFRPFTWRAGRWSATGYPDPRPLYRLKELGEDSEPQVLVVEGEKCADAAAKVLTMAVTTWSHGASSVDKNDWTPLHGRDVLIWPDADDPGTKAAAWLAGHLQGKAYRVRVVQTNGQPVGWDIADAIAEGWDHDKIVDWMKAKLTRDVAPAQPPPPVIQAGEQSESAISSWQALGLDMTEGGAPHATVANGSAIIATHPQLQGKIWYDTFTDKVYTNLKGGAPRQWTDADDLDLTVFIQHSMRLHKFNVMLVSSAAIHAARRNSRNSLTDYLDGLQWDGIERLETWLTDILGCDQNEYTMAVAVNWPISMVARAYVPGCKVDTMPVLEGAQGMAKSTFLEVLGDPWYGSIPTGFGDKDFLQAIQGHWLVEIPDMAAFSRREQGQILATMAIRKDIYRASYGRHTVTHPRVTVFGATSETDDYLQDMRGRRRYWPLRCREINLDALRAQRDQIFAEARDRYRNGAKWYVMPDSADEEQTQRAAPDLWTDRVIDYCTDLAGQRIAVTSSRILSDAIELPLAKQTDAEKRRIARIMRENGWVQKRDAYGRKWKKVERPT